MWGRGEPIILPDFLVLSTLVIFSLLWLSDLLITRKTVAEMGESAEVNPIMRKLLTKKDRYLYTFKTIELAAFVYLIYYISSFSGGAAFHILLSYIIVFGLIVANNARIYHRVTNQFSKIFLGAFIVLLMVSVSFIYLNHSLFDDLQNTYDELDDCRQNMTELEVRCQEADISSDTSIEDQSLPKKNIIDTLEVSI